MNAALARLEPLRYARTGTLEVAYFHAGPSNGDAALLLHGFPYDIHSYIDVIPRLVAAGLRVIVPYLRGHGPTRFLDSSSPRSGQQAAIGTDVIALLDTLEIPRAILAGYDWGGRGVCRPPLSPDRCTGIVSVNSYLIQGHRQRDDPRPPRSRTRLLVLLLLPDRVSCSQDRRGHRADRGFRPRQLDIRQAMGWLQGAFDKGGPRKASRPPGGSHAAFKWDHAPDRGVAKSGFVEVAAETSRFA